jgi:glycosyltransferase involved in cell wall biosynthesis
MRSLDTQLIPALFVSAESYLAKKSGGVQMCTQEYWQLLTKAGFDLKPVPYSPNQDLLSRIKRRVYPQPYHNRLPNNLLEIVLEAVKIHQPQHIFLNLVDVAPLAIELRQQLGPDIQLIMLSHGLESTDIFHGLRTRDEGAPFKSTTNRDRRFLGESLVEECKHRQNLDKILCLSAFDAEIERWLGAKSVIWVPRIIPAQKLEWQPRGNRFGFVGTIDHIPNREGLILFLEALQSKAPQGTSVRLIGGPESVAQTIADRFPIVEYLGRLSDEDLFDEAATWNAFVHPLFCYARGCSTKLAMPLGWEIPVVTTTPGHRGYQWSLGTLQVADTPEELANLALSLLDPQKAQIAQQECAKIANSALKLEALADRMRQYILAA